MTENATVSFPTPVEAGGHIFFVDEKGVEHSALVTQVWGQFGEDGLWTEEALKNADPSVRQRFVGTPLPPPSVNLVYVSLDPRNRDPYGQQIDRRSSVPHQSAQGAPGMFWRNT